MPEVPPGQKPVKVPAGGEPTLAQMFRALQVSGDWQGEPVRQQGCPSVPQLVVDLQIPGIVCVPVPIQVNPAQQVL
ncbi:hypothetical protein HYW29_00020 [Candidatus Amesbacteria bacterium]|nr:hypothetical protein [Candidatus Amesbacteria bacterium]